MRLWSVRACGKKVQCITNHLEYLTCTCKPCLLYRCFHRICRLHPSHRVSSLPRDIRVNCCNTLLLTLDFHSVRSVNKCIFFFPQTLMCMCRDWKSATDELPFSCLLIRNTRDIKRPNSALFTDPSPQPVSFSELLNTSRN